MQPLAKFLTSSFPETPHIGWHLLVNRTVQRNKTSCSVASLCIAFNGLASALNARVEDDQINECVILDMLSDSNLRRNLSEGTGGATLEQIAQMAAQAIPALGGLKLSVAAHHMNEPGGDYLNNFKKNLAESGETGTSVIIANYHQGVIKSNDLTHGHFSPVAPIGANIDLVCVVDPSFAGPPFVIDADHLGRAMATEDKTSGHNRGYLKIAVRTD